VTQTREPQRAWPWHFGDRGREDRDVRRRMAVRRGDSRARRELSRDPDLANKSSCSSGARMISPPRASNAVVDGEARW